MSVFLCHPRCTTCEKARKWLKANQIQYTLRDITAQNPTGEEIRSWARESGLPLKRFFNTSGQKYREQGLKDKLEGMDEQAQIDCLASDGMLVKRPIFVKEGIVLVGFREKAWEEALL